LVVVTCTNALLPSLLTRLARSWRKGTPRYRLVEHLNKLVEDGVFENFEYDDTLYE